MRAPQQSVHKLIVDTANGNRSWGRIRICEELRARGHDIHQPEVNYVLYHCKLPNLCL